MPTRQDSTALRILDVAAELIDASLSEVTADLPPRLKSIRFPAALEWIRIEDIVRIAAAYQPAISKKAILNRWSTKEELVRDAALHCILYRDQPEGGTPDATPELMVEAATAGGLAHGIAVAADSILTNLLTSPRSFLLMHLAPMLPRHPDIQTRIAADSLMIQQRWAEGYLQLISAFGLRLRPEWTLDRLSLCLQMLLDGYMVRTRIDQRLTDDPDPGPPSMLARAVTSLIVGAIDHEQSGKTAAAFLDTAVTSFAD